MNESTIKLPRSAARRSGMTMERKLTLIIFAAIVVALTVASSALIYNAARAARQQTIDDLTTLADVIGNNSQAALMFQDPEDGADILAALASKPIVNAARLYDASGSGFASFQRPDISLDLPDQAPLLDHVEPWEDQGHLWMIRAIIRDGEGIGTVLIAADLDPLQQMISQQIYWSILITIGAALLAGLLASRVLHLLLKHIRIVVDMATAVAHGSLPDELPITAHDEIGELQAAFNQIVETTRNVVQQTQTVARGDYSITIRPRSDQDELARALIEMTAKLKVFHEESEKLATLKSGLSDLNDRMRGEPQLDTLLQQILSGVSQHLDALAAVIYLRQPDGCLEQAAGDAGTGSGLDRQRWQPGEGLVGRAALERRLLRVAAPDEQALPLRSGLVEGQLKELVLLPLIHDQDLAGVLEVGRLAPFTSGHLEYLQQASSSIAIAIESAQSRARLDELLTETRRQSERLREQQSELQSSNQELEERNLLLERQKQEIHRQKDELEAAQLDLERKARELEMASKYKSEFLANMSHELRTPLNSMLILSRLLSENKSGNLTDKQQEFAHTIHKAGSDLLTLINDILDLSKVEAGKLELHVEPTSLREIANALHSIFQPLAEEKGLDFQIDTETSLPDAIKTDGQRVSQILRNLLGNAFKFTQAGRVTLRIRAAHTDEKHFAQDGVALDVEDTGIGIPDDKKNLIFHAFQQADGTTSRKFGGTGLGLSISRELAIRLGGDIHVASEPGKGSTFTLVLPQEPTITAATPTPRAEQPTAVPAPRRTPTIPPPQRPPPSADARTLLVIDDDPTFAGVVAEYAEGQGFHVMRAADGKEGLQLARDHLPFGIILDMMLPTTDGHAVLTELKKDAATRVIPVFVISALDHDQEMMRQGAIGFATKPVSMPDLALALKRMNWVRSRTTKTILVVDDHTPELQAVAELLAGWPVDIRTCTTGAEAIQIVQSNSIDIVLLDWGLPDMTGKDVLAALHPSVPAAYLPIVLYTGRDLDREEEAYIRRRVVSVIVKGAQTGQRLPAKLAFYLHIPLPQQKQHPVAGTSHNGQSGNHSLAGARILIVDDDMRNLYSLASLLESLGAESIAAADGHKALEVLAHESRLDLILMDIMMPVMDGYEAIREIRKQEAWRDVPIIALTAHAMQEDRNACLAVGANAYLSKPIDLDQLTIAATTWINSSATP